MLSTLDVVNRPPADLGAVSELLRRETEVGAAKAHAVAELEGAVLHEAPCSAWNRRTALTSDPIWKSSHIGQRFLSNQAPS